MNTGLLFRALADETRRKVITLLLSRNPCVTELARALSISESAVSQHLKVLKQAGLLIGERRGYYMHYDIDREMLRMLAREIESLAALERGHCDEPEPGAEGCVCNLSGESCSALVKRFCHGDACMGGKVKLPMAALPQPKE